MNRTDNALKIYRIGCEGIKRIKATLNDLADYYEIPALALIDANALASEIEDSESFNMSMNINGYFDHELGRRTPQGHVMTLAVYPSDCVRLVRDGEW